MKEITIKEIIVLLKNKFIILLTLTLIFFMLGIFYTFTIVKNRYISKGSIMIQVESNEGNINTMESQRLVQSTVDILTKMNLVPEETVKTLKSNGYDVTVEMIKANMSVTSSNMSLVININYISFVKEEAKAVVDEIINTLIKVANDEQYNMDKTLKNNISKLYVSEAEYYSPNKSLLITLGAIFGLVLGLIVIFINEMINSGYKEKDEIEEELNIQVLGVIPNFEIKRGSE